MRRYTVGLSNVHSNAMQDIFFSMESMHLLVSITKAVLMKVSATADGAAETVMASSEGECQHIQKDNNH